MWGGAGADSPRLEGAVPALRGDTQASVSAGASLCEQLSSPARRPAAMLAVDVLRTVIVLPWLRVLFQACCSRNGSDS